MPVLNTQQTADPLTTKGSFEFTAEDLNRAFQAPSDPDEVLFFDLYGPDFESKPVSERFRILSDVARLAEAAQDLGVVVRGVSKTPGG